MALALGSVCSSNVAEVPALFDRITRISMCEILELNRGAHFEQAGRSEFV